MPTTCPEPARTSAVCVKSCNPPPHANQTMAPDTRLDRGWRGIAAQTGKNDPRVGYLSPAGACRNTTVEVLAGGQDLRSMKEVRVSGTGVEARIIKTYRMPRNLDGDQRELLKWRIACRRAETQRQTDASETPAETRPGRQTHHRGAAAGESFVRHAWNHGHAADRALGDGLPTLRPQTAEPAARRTRADRNQDRRQRGARHARTASRRPARIHQSRPFRNRNPARGVRNRAKRAGKPDPTTTSPPCPAPSTARSSRAMWMSSASTRGAARTSS